MFKLKIVLISLLFFIVYTSNGQSTRIHNLIEILGKDSLKVYLDNIFKIAYEPCASYYLVTKLNNDVLRFEGKVNVYFKDGQLYSTGNYKNGKKEGKFEFFYPRGKLKCVGFYKNDNRDSTWSYFHPNNKIKKIIHYKRGTELLEKLQDEEGNLLVKNYEGRFKDRIPNSNVNDLGVKVQGQVKEGRPEGKWEMYTNGIKTGTEYFSSGKFQKGISHSIKFGDEVYHEKPLSNFYGIEHLENVEIIGPSSCKDYSSAGINKEFYENLKQLLKKYLSTDNVINSWYLVSLNLNTNKEIKNIKVNSFKESMLVDRIIEAISSMKVVKSQIKIEKQSYEYFPIIIFNREIYIF